MIVLTSSAFESRLSTTQAAQILDVHESSIKRWCNTGILECDLTAGGHRRIRLDALVAFAKRRLPSARVLSFDGFEGRVWAAFTAAIQSDTDSELVDLVREWLNHRDVTRLSELLHFLREMGLASADIYDRVVSPVMHGVGEDWTIGAISTGDEHRMTQTMIDVLRLQHGLEKTTGGAKTSNNDDGKRLNGEGNNELDRNVAIVGCVMGERHELGALLVRLLLTEVGWHVVYLGQDVPPEDLAAQQRRYRATLVCVSIMPPRGRVEAIATTRLLGTLYDSAYPYRLAIGGPNVGDQLPTLGSLPETHTFAKLRDFVDWVVESMGTGVNA